MTDLGIIHTSYLIFRSSFGVRSEELTSEDETGCVANLKSSRLFVQGAEANLITRILVNTVSDQKLRYPISVDRLCAPRAEAL